jgi:hypothetical protein
MKNAQWNAALKGAGAIITGLSDDFADGKLTLGELAYRMSKVSEEVLKVLGVWDQVVCQPHNKYVRVGDFIKMGEEVVDDVLRRLGLDTYPVIKV